jgi:hypothetical protein
LSIEAKIDKIVEVLARLEGSKTHAARIAEKTQINIGKDKYFSLKQIEWAIEELVLTSLSIIDTL